MTLAITSFYAALAAFVFLVLTWRVIAYRKSNRLSLGHMDDKNLLKRMRAQANWVETAPISIILIALVEAQGAPGIAVHLLGLMLVAGRVLHAMGFARTPQILILRQIGMLLTLMSIAFAALGLLGHALF